MSIEQKIAELLEESKKLQESQISESAEYHNKMADQHNDHAIQHEKEATNGGSSDHDHAAIAHENAESAHKKAAEAFTKHGGNSEEYKNAAEKAKNATSSAKETSSSLRFRKVGKPKSIQEENHQSNEISEEADHVSSGELQHSLETPEEKKEHAAHMKKTHGVKTTFHGDDEVQYHGPKKAVKKAVIAHYHGDHEDAKELHPHLFENVSNDMRIDMSQDVEALVNGEDLSEEFKTKASTIFEAAVITRVKQEVAKLEEQFDVKLQEEVNTIKEGLVEKVDGYLNYVVESWIEDNEIALESGIKTEIVESFIHGMKGLFEQHYIDVPEEKYDVLGEMEKTVKSLEEKLNESMESSIGLKKELNEMKRASIVKEFSEDMAATDSEKFKALAEELSFEDSSTFSSKLKTIRENYFGKKTTTSVASVVSDEPVTLNEETELSPTMKAYLKQLNSLK